MKGARAQDFHDRARRLREVAGELRRRKKKLIETMVDKVGVTSRHDCERDLVFVTEMLDHLESICSGANIFI